MNMDENKTKRYLLSEVTSSNCYNVPQIRSSLPRAHSILKCENCGKITDFSGRKTRSVRPQSLHTGLQMRQQGTLYVKEFRNSIESSSNQTDLRNMKRKLSEQREVVYEDVDKINSGMETLDIRIKVTNAIIKASNHDFSRGKEKYSPQVDKLSSLDSSNNKHIENRQNISSESQRRSNMKTFKLNICKKWLNKFNKMLPCSG